MSCDRTRDSSAVVSGGRRTRAAWCRGGHSGCLCFLCESDARGLARAGWDCAPSGCARDCARHGADIHVEMDVLCSRDGGTALPMHEGEVLHGGGGGGDVVELVSGAVCRRWDPHRCRLMSRCEARAHGAGGNDEGRAVSRLRIMLQGMVGTQIALFSREEPRVRRIRSSRHQKIAAGVVPGRI